MMNADEAVRFDREESDAIFMETLNDLDNLNNRDGRFAYADYVTLHNDISALYDSFSYVDELINSLQSQLAEAQRREQAAVKCIYDIETYLQLGSAKYIKSTIDNWRGPQKEGEGKHD